MWTKIRMPQQLIVFVLEQNKSTGFGLAFGSFTFSEQTKLCLNLQAKNTQLDQIMRNCFKYKRRTPK